METITRLTASIAIFFIMICWEYLSPRRVQLIKRKARWPVNIGLALFNIILMRLTVGSIAYLSAVNADQHSWGLLNWLAAPEWLSIIATLLFLDFAIYCQHIVSHKWSPLWHLHQVHHTDLEFDATTAVRFHPLEILISMLYKVLCIYLIGADRISMDLHLISEKVNSRYINYDIDYTYNKRSDPNQFYYRSDHYNFAKNGIPVIFYFSGVHKDYHKPTDDVDKINFDKVQKTARMVFYTAWEIANRDKKLRMNGID